MGVQNDGDLMFQCDCDEPGGVVTRNVYKVEFTPQNLEIIYQKAKKFRTLMGWEIPTYEHFISFFVTPENGIFKARGICARVDDFVGIFWLTDINYTHPPHEATIHYTFFDRRHKGRLELCRKAITYCFETFNFSRLTTMVPLYMFQPGDLKEDGSTTTDATKWSVLNFVERIGFRKEGRQKEKMIYKGHLFDANLYALTKDECLSGSAWKEADLKHTGKNKWADQIQITQSK